VEKRAESLQQQQVENGGRDRRGKMGRTGVEEQVGGGKIDLESLLRSLPGQEKKTLLWEGEMWNYRRKLRKEWVLV